MGPRGAPAAMLGMGMQQFVSQPHAAAPVFQQPEHLHGGVFGQHHHQPVPAPARQQPPSYSPYPAVPVRAGGGHHEEEAMGHGAGNDGVAAQQQQQPGGLWSRMKWTDAMVRLLIMVVYNAGDDGEGAVAAAIGGGGGGGGSRAAAHGHGHGSATAAAHAQQKKGKWKSVSRTMGEHGFTVSPQQCEDKFNDLNKRYKRVVDLLGRGKACAVVESPALLDAMDELPPRAKEEARKLLSSKHLFFREMCNYHNSPHPHAAAAVTVASHHGAAVHDHEGAAACFHHPQPVACASSAAALHALAPSPAMMNSSTRTEGDEEDDDSENAHPRTSNEVEEMDEEDVLDDEEEQAPGIKSKHRRFHSLNSNGFPKRRRGESSTMEAEEDGNNNDNTGAGEGEAPSSAGVQHLQSELAAAAGGGDPEQARRWMRRRALAVEEQLLACDYREYKLHRQRLKWERFCAGKEREMELAKLRNERARIDGRRMLLMIQHKEMDLLRGSSTAGEACNNSSSVDHNPRQTPPFSAFQQQQQLGSSPSTAGGHHS